MLGEALLCWRARVKPRPKSHGNKMRLDGIKGETRDQGKTYANSSSRKERRSESEGEGEGKCKNCKVGKWGKTDEQTNGQMGAWGLGSTTVAHANGMNENKLISDSLKKQCQLRETDLNLEGVVAGGWYSSDRRGG